MSASIDGQIQPAVRLPVDAVAACMGHSDGSMVAKVYSHIDKDDAHLKRALID